MQQSTTHSPLDVATDLPWQEQLLIRLDEIVGLLDSIESRLARSEEVRFQLSGCQRQGTQETRHADAADLPSVVYLLPPTACPLPSVACALPSSLLPPGDTQEPPP